MAFPWLGPLLEQPSWISVPHASTFGAIVVPGPTSVVAAVVSAALSVTRVLDPHLMVHEQARVGIQHLFVLTLQRHQIPDRDVITGLPVHPEALDNPRVHTLVGDRVGVTIAIQVRVHRNETRGLTWLGRNRHGVTLVDDHHANLGVTLSPRLGTRAQALKMQPTRARKLADAHPAGRGHPTMRGATVHDPPWALRAALLRNRPRHRLCRHRHLLGARRTLHGCQVALDLSDLGVELVHLGRKTLCQRRILFGPRFHDRDLRNQDALLHAQRLHLEQVTVVGAEALGALVSVPVVELVGAGAQGDDQKKGDQDGQKDGFDGLHGFLRAASGDHASRCVRGQPETIPSRP